MKPIHHGPEHNDHVTEPQRGIPSSLPSNAVLMLQRSAGNRAVSTIVSAAASAATRHAAMIGFEQSLIQDIASSEPAGHIVTARGRLTPIRRGGLAGSHLSETGNQGAAMGDVVLLTESAPDARRTEGQALLQHEAEHIDQQGGVPVRPAAREKERAESEAAGNQGMLPYIGYSFGASTVARKAAAKAVRWLSRRGASVSAHIMTRHVARKLSKSRFIQGKFVKKWVEATLKSTDNVVNQGRRVVFQREFGSTVGYGGERIVRVVVDRITGKIVTAFPAKTFLRMAVVGSTAAASAAQEADAAILARRAAVEEMLDDPWPVDVLNFLLDTSTTARSEDPPAEDRIVDEAVAAAIEAVEEQLQQSLDQDDRDEITEMVLTEMYVE